MAEAKNLAKLLHQWMDGTKTYRLVAEAKTTAGYEDYFIIEVEEKDTLGGPRWTKVDTWSKEDRDSRTLLVGVVKNLIETSGWRTSYPPSGRLCLLAMEKKGNYALAGSRSYGYGLAVAVHTDGRWINPSTGDEISSVDVTRWMLIPEIP